MSKLSQWVEFLDSRRIPLSGKQRENLAKIYPYYGAQGIIDYVDNYIFDGTFLLVGEDGSVLTPRGTPIVNWATGKIWVNNHAHVLREKNGCNLKYIYYLLSCTDARGYITGSVQPKLNQENLASIEVQMPEIEIQKRVVNMLSSLDAKIANNNAINAELEAMANTIYDYWFLQFDFPDENGKPYKSSGGKMVYNEELKHEIPEGWSIDKISSVAMLYQPQTISENEMMADGKYFVYGANGIVGKYHSFNHESNEIAICCRGASCGQFIMTQPLAWITGNAMVVKPTSFCGREYLFYGLSYKTIAPYITGSAQPQITRTNLENMRVLIPDRETVNKFEQFALEIRAKTQMIFAENQELASLRDFLLPLLMNGQVGFKD